MNRHETLNKVTNCMMNVDAHCLNQVKGPVGSLIEFWQVGRRVVIVQYWKDGGCTHFVASKRNSWEDFATELHQLAAESTNG